MTRGRCSRVKLRHVREKLAFSRMSRARASILGAHMRESEDVSSGSAPRACPISCQTNFFEDVSCESVDFGGSNAESEDVSRGGRLLRMSRLKTLLFLKT